MSKRILVTGATGFVGSALAAGLLADGHEVVTLGRDDADGARTRAAIAAAARGFGRGEPDWRRLETHEVVFARLDDALAAAPRLAAVDEAWHCAAEMSFSPHKLAACAHQNITVTATLHQALGRARRCRRFYHLSTAFTAGNAGGRVPERLHAAPVLVNAYQLTKWGAEQMLAVEHARGGVPVTLVRTTGVTGHAESGWFKSRFGLYLFFDLVAQARAAGAAALTLALTDGARPNLVPVDFVLEVARRLGARGDDGGGFEVVHCAGRAVLTTHQILVAAGAALGVAVGFGAPATALERTLDQALAPVRPFVEIHWEWETSALERALPGLVVPTVDAARLERLLAAYVAAIKA